MKNKIIVFLTILLFSTLWSGCSSNKKEENNTIKIGAILPLTGPASFIGEQHKSGINYAVDMINGNKSNKKINVIYEDDKGEAKNAISAFNKLTQTDGVNIVITAMSSSSLALIKPAEEDKVVLFANCGYPTIAKKSNWVFRNFPSSKQEVEKMIVFLANKQMLDKMGILYIDDAYGESAKNEIVSNLKKFNKEPLFIESYRNNTIDYKPFIFKALSTKPNRIYVFGYGSPTARLIKQIRAAGYSKTLIGSYNFSVAPIYTTDNKQLEGSYFTSPKFDLESNVERVKQFKLNYKKKYGKDPVWNTIVEYDAINIIYKAMSNNTINNGENIKKSLRNIGDYNGIAGKYKFNKYGEWLPILEIRTIKNGKIQPIKNK